MSKALTLNGLATQIRAEHQAAESAARTAVEHARHCGDLLFEAKSRCKHGAWLSWLQENCEIPERTAQAYMRVARAMLDSGKAQRVADLPLRQALVELSESHRELSPDELLESINLALEEIAECGPRDSRHIERRLEKLLNELEADDVAKIPLSVRMQYAEFIEEMPAREVTVGFRRREDVGSLESLEGSLSRHGMLHPIIVDRDGLLVCGERRLRAAMDVGWDVVPARRANVTRDENFLLQLEENTGRMSESDLAERRAQPPLGAFDA